jgi:NAD(P)-dependent dehydrogenase (short-subunit alcohol dehydrogenase family)
MKNLALEWGAYGIRSNSIVPGPIEGTEGLRRLGGEDYARTRMASIPLGRFGTLDDIGQAAVFLASPLASYVTGTMLVVDGGSNLSGSASFAEAMRAKQSDGVS